MKTRDKVFQWITFGVALAINLFILINAFIPGQSSGHESNTIAKVFSYLTNAVSPGSVTEDNFQTYAALLRKIVGHFALFLVDGAFTSTAVFFLLQSKKKNNILLFISLSLVIGGAVATVSELIQVFIPERYGSYYDILIDFGGYLLGFIDPLIVFLISKKFVPLKTQK